ncbi:MAG: 6-phosphogluconolactonase [Candidatus Krumholzibacteriia bacterium]
MPKLTTFPDPAAFAVGAAELIVEIAAAAVAARGRFTVALAGGGTPQPVYARLAAPAFAGRIAWDRTDVFFGDERCVPPDDERSNFRMAREALLAHVPLRPDGVHRIRGEDDPASAALAYEQELRRVFHRETVPALDLVCLGLGDNGHTASLFPGTASLHERERWMVPQYVEALASWRVTATAPLINAARHVVFLVAGAGKADVLARVLVGAYEPDVLPAQLVQPSRGEVRWLVDAAAAARLPSGFAGDREPR